MPRSAHAAASSTKTPRSSETEISKGIWSQEDHDLFLEAMQIFPNGPWELVAGHVGTRSARQAQTHAQKYHEKIARRLRGLQKLRLRVQRQEHRIEDEMLEICDGIQNESLQFSSMSPGYGVSSDEEPYASPTTQPSRVTTCCPAVPSSATYRLWTSQSENSSYSPDCCIHKS